MAEQREQVEALTAALNEATAAKEMALTHAAEADAELQALRRHAAQLSDHLGSAMAGRAPVRSQRQTCVLFTILQLTELLC